MKYTVYYSSGEAKFITTDTPVIRVFEGNRRIGTGIARKDVQVRFPLSRKAFLTITHDLRLTEALVKASESKRAKLLEKLPEIQIRYIRDTDVLAFNKGHARHARMWAFSSQEWDWMNEILSVRSAAPEIVDLSGRDLYHFQSRVNYDPRIDSAK